MEHGRQSEQRGVGKMKSGSLDGTQVGLGANGREISLLLFLIILLLIIINILFSIV